jgi:hypothetical protein
METNPSFPAFADPLNSWFSPRDGSGLSGRGDISNGKTDVPPVERVPLWSCRAASARHWARAPVFALACALVLALAAVPARAEGEAGTGPCDGLVAYLRETLAGPPPLLAKDLEADYFRRESHLEGRLRSTLPMMPPAYTTRVTPACGAETRRGAAPEATAAAPAWTQRPEVGWIDRGRILLCTMQDPTALGELPAWMADVDHDEARAVCASELATWPGAGPSRGPILARALRRHSGNWPDNWEIDMAVVAAANAMGTPELREQLVSVLATARARQAVGYDRLRAAVCTDDGIMSADRVRVCSTLPAQAEDDWGQQRKRTDLWTVRIGATASYATLTALALDQKDGPNIATAAGVFAGAMVGGGVVGGVVGKSTGDKVKAEGASIAGAIAGGVLGGMAAHALADSPGRRAVVTGVGFAPLYLSFIVLTK